MIKRIVKGIVARTRRKKFVPLAEVSGSQESASIQKVISNSAYYIKKLYNERGATFKVENEKDLCILIDGLKFKINGFEELFIINEVFNEMVYNFISPDNIIVVDIGSNIGSAALFFSKYPNIKSIVGFEPVKETYRRLQENLSLNGNPEKIIINNYGLGKCNKEEYFEFSDEFKGSVGLAGLNKEKQSQSSNIRKVQVEIRDSKEIVENILAHHPGDNILIKMDCEGGEYEILPRLYETGILKKVKYIVMEWHGEEYKELINYFSDHTCFYHRETPTTGMLYAVLRN